MPIDHFWVDTQDDQFNFDDVDYAEWKTKPLYLNEDYVYMELYLKATSGTVYVKFTVTDSESSTATGATSTAETSWQAKTGSNRIQIDCSSLTAGEATCKCETKGEGSLKDVYGYQSS